MSRLETSILLGAAVILAVAVQASAADRYKGFERAEALITVQELQQLSDAKDSRLVILGVVEPLSFGAGHIPGSINIWRPDYELKVGQPYPFEGVILDRTQFQDFARGLGINNDSRVVVYDEKYDATSVWWAFFLYGKTDVRVLDGGYPAWKAAGYATESLLSGARPARVGDFVARQHGAAWFASMEDVRRARAAKIGYWVGQTDLQIKTLNAWIALAEKRLDEAVQLMRVAAEAEETSDKSPVTPGNVVPSRELLGEMLLVLNQAAQAFTEFERSLQRDPNRFWGMSGAGRAAEAAGNHQAACEYYAKLQTLTADRDTERPELTQSTAFLARQ